LSFAAVQDVISSGRVPLICIPTDAFKKLTKASRFPDAWRLAMRPHETAALLERLEAQNRWSPEQITQKLAAADKDMEWIHAQQEQNRFDKVLKKICGRSIIYLIICIYSFLHLKLQ